MPAGPLAGVAEAELVAGRSGVPAALLLLCAGAACPPSRLRRGVSGRALAVAASRREGDDKGSVRRAGWAGMCIERKFTGRCLRDWARLPRLRPHGATLHSSWQCDVTEPQPTVFFAFLNFG